jgi:hypothetical protein
LIGANSDAQNVPSFRRWRFKKKRSPSGPFFMSACQVLPGSACTMTLIKPFGATAKRPAVFKMPVTGQNLRKRAAGKENISKKLSGSDDSEDIFNVA